MSARFGLLRRFGWLIPVTIVIVTAIATLVATKTSSKSSATAVVVVSPGTGSPGPGEGAEADNLAGTYATQLRADDSLLKRVQAVTGLSRSTVQGNIAAVHVPNTAQIDVTFTAQTAGQAIKGLHAVSSFVTSPPSDSSLSTVSPLVVGADHVGAVTARGPTKGATVGGYAARATVVIPSVPENGPGDAYEANILAATLTGLIPSDQPTLNALAQSMHLPATTVKNSVSATNEQNTSLIAVTFTSSSSRVAQAGAVALARSVSGAHPTSPNIPPGSLSIVSLPARPTAGSPLKLAIPAGVVLGLALAGILMAALARAFPRVDDEHALSALASCPASPIRLDDLGAISVLKQRWSTFVGWPGGTVALVTPTAIGEKCASAVAEAINGLDRLDSLNGSTGSSSTPDEAEPTNGNGAPIRWGRAKAVAERLAHAGPRDEVSSPVPATRRFDASASPQTASPTRPTRRENLLTARLAGALDRDGRAERVALDSDLAVLVVAKGTKDADVERTVRVLTDYGRSPSWAVLVPRVARRRKRNSRSG